jgi:hypothetical protein
MVDSREVSRAARPPSDHLGYVTPLRVDSG